MAKEQSNYPASLDSLTVDRQTGEVVPSAAFDIIEDAITKMQAEMRRVTTKTGAVTLTSSEGGLILVSAGSPYSLGLPPASNDLKGLTYFIVKTDDNSNLITLDAEASETINGVETYTDLDYQYAYVIIRLDGSNWVILCSSKDLKTHTDAANPHSGSAASGANTDLTSLLNVALYIGRDADNQIKFADDNQMTFRLAGVDGLKMNSEGLDLHEKNVVFDPTLTGDHSYSGFTDVVTVGESVVFGELLYYDDTDEEWKKADASDSGTMPGLCIALESKANGEACKVLRMGYIRDDSWDWSVADILYTSETAGDLVATPPADSGDQVQRVGYAIHADKIFFNPSMDVGEI